MKGKLELYEAKLGQYQVRLQYLGPESRLRENRERMRLLEQEFRDAMEQKIQQYRHALGIYLERYKGLSPLSKLNRGYAFVSDEEGRAVTKISQASSGQRLEISVTDGVIEAEVSGCRKENWNI